MLRSYSVGDGRMMMEHLWNDADKWTPKWTRRKLCPRATLSTINPIRTGPGLNPSLRSEKLVTNTMAQAIIIIIIIIISISISINCKLIPAS
jgi:hypothetical protein